MTGPIFTMPIVTGFESGCASKIVFGRVVTHDSVANAAVVNENQSIVIRSDDLPRVEIGRAIRRDELDIRAAGERFTMQPAFESSADDLHRPPFAGRRFPDTEGSRYLDYRTAQRFQTRSGRFVLFAGHRIIVQSHAC